MFMLCLKFRFAVDLIRKICTTFDLVVRWREPDGGAYHPVSPARGLTEIGRPTSSEPGLMPSQADQADATPP